MLRSVVCSGLTAHQSNNTMSPLTKREVVACASILCWTGLLILTEHSLEAVLLAFDLAGGVSVRCLELCGCLKALVLYIDVTAICSYTARKWHNLLLSCKF